MTKTRLIALVAEMLNEFDNVLEDRFRPASASHTSEQIKAVRDAVGVELGTGADHLFVESEAILRKVGYTEDGAE